MTLNTRDSVIYEFAEFRLDPRKRSLVRSDGNLVALTARPFDTLFYLVQNSGRVVSRDEILEKVWTDTIVEENNLTQSISALRRVFGEGPGEQRYIVTVPGRGYKFVANVERIELPDALSENKVPDQVTQGLERSEKAIWSWSRHAVILALLLCAVSLAGYFFLSGRAPEAQAAARSIAVLPFKPISLSDRDESFELGMTEALITKLAAADGLDVKPLTAVRRFGSSDQDALEAGRRLGVERVLENSVQISNGRVRVTAKLIDVGEQKQIWAEQFDEALTDIFTLQNTISDRVANALKVKLNEVAKRRYTDNVEAYQLYLRGRFHVTRLSPPEILRGLGYFEKAVEIDPNYALAYAGIADAYRALVLSGEYSPSENFQRSTLAAERSLQLDPNLAEAYASIATTDFWYRRDWPASDAAFKRALDLDPRASLSRSFYAHMLSNVGRHDEALQQAELARQADPNNTWLGGIEGLVLLQAGRGDEAVERLKGTLAADPNLWLARLFLGKAYLRLGLHNDALAEFQKASELNRLQTIAPAYEVMVLAKLGRNQESRAKIGQLERIAAERYLPPYHLAIAYYGLGDKEKALSLLDRAYEERDQKMVFLRVDEAWAGLASDPRYLDLLRRMNL